MRNLIIFIRRYFHFFLFLLLEILCLTLVWRNNAYQRSSFLNTTADLVGSLYQRVHTIQDYFDLKSVNDSLARENARLHNELLAEFHIPDTSSQLVRDTAGHRQYLYLSAEVVNNSVNTGMNTFTIDRGRLGGIGPNMGVVSSSGVAGIVIRVSDHFSVVMSLLHRDSRTSVRLARTGTLGYVHWDGRDPAYGILSDIPKSETLSKGDLVLTSGFSILFPPDIPVGQVTVIRNSGSRNFQSAVIRYATDFSRLEFVEVIRNNSADEQKALESAIPHE